MRIAGLVALLVALYVSLVLSLSLFGVVEGGGDEPRVIKTGPEQFEVVTETGKLAYKRSDVKFIDVTETVALEELVAEGILLQTDRSLWTQILTIGAKKLKYVKKPFVSYKYPKKASYEKQVKSLYEEISVAQMKKNLAVFTSFYTRYYKSATGVESAKWLFEQLRDISSGVPGYNVTVNKFGHKKWDQFSIIARIEGESSEKVVLGSHQDSLNLLFPNLLKAPGADDDGSGTVTVLETFRLLVGQLKHGFKPEKTVEFHFYSAEEGGLLGSMDVFGSYSKKGEKVIAMLQQDMTGSTVATVDAGKPPHFGLITDYTSEKLNEYLKVLIKTYCDIPYHETSCGYACSDHASAIENGYPAACVLESEFQYMSKFVHSVWDTIDRIDWEHVREHVKLSLAYVYELGSKQ